MSQSLGKKSKQSTQSHLETLLPYVPRETLERLVLYVDLITQWNQKMNLTGAKSPQDFCLQHVLDCVRAWMCIPSPLEGEGVWLDIGSGAGLPGIVWACLNQNQSFILIEPLKKRSAFLMRAISHLALENVEVINKRLEEVSQKEVILICNELGSPEILSSALSPEGRGSKKQTLNWPLTCPAGTLSQREREESIYCVSRGTMSPPDLLSLAKKASIPWKEWFVFSTAKTHEEFENLVRKFGLHVEKINYEKRKGEVGVLTWLRR